ncbi:hypothetical protein C7999DRAFT_10897 [Corynascus novoguineensis]|uniref:NACHT domain-containing protein n=1 Tax=Corynascus novoguineensis TaxID=1126955 RepID=A0AAN7HNG5_9PEZI|nr:hypothetical protein C7999DRAFT_10897 [Corynascus novoguineensis]
MGGLVVKQAYLLALRETAFKPVADRVRSIFFLATPHRGAAIARIFSSFTSIIGPRPFFEDLYPQSDVVQALSENFPKESRNLQLFSFYESRPMSVGLNKVLIVDKASAVMNLPNERQTFLDANHRNMAMYATRTDSSYLAVRNALTTVVLSYRTQIQHALPASQEDLHALAQFLGVPADPEDDLQTHAAAKIPGSCQWLTEKDCYQSWMMSKRPAFLWLQGRPGAGKSILSSHVVGDLRNSGLNVCFFFFRARDDAKSTADSCLRSLAWQMARMHPDIFSRLKSIMSESKERIGEKVGSHTLWQRVFVSGILTVTLNKPQFWVIDAMDECRGATDMTAFLAATQKSWPLSLLVTSRDAVENYLQSVNSNISIHSYAIGERDSAQDILLLLEANLAALPCSTSKTWPTPEAIASHILEKSAGCFLWASLTCSAICRATSDGGIRRILNGTPAEMGALYVDSLARIETNNFEKEAIRAIFTWTLHAFRPLRLAEMQIAAELDIDDKISDINRVISRGCGNLIYVDQHDKVQLMHLTVRDFLTRDDVKPSLIPPATETHRRLAFTCLKHLMAVSQKVKGRAKRVQEDQSSLPFTDYACRYLFQHLSYSDPSDEALLLMLVNFLGSDSLLRWIESAANNGDLRSVYEAGKTINDILGRRAIRDTEPLDHSPPTLTQENIELLRRWGDDLSRLIPRFAERLRNSPKTIRHHIAPLCPPDSAIRQVFGGPARGLTVGGLSTRGWDDCLTTIRYPQGSSPFVAAAAPGYVAVGVASRDGRVVVHEDTIFQELHTIHHGERVTCIAFAVNGEYLASAGTNAVRVWAPANGLELGCFELPHAGGRCRALAFAEENTILRAAMEQNQLVEWDLKSGTLVHDELVSWGVDLPERMRGRVPVHVWLSPGSNLLAVLYRGHDLVFWDCAELRLHDVYEQETGSMLRFGNRSEAMGWTTVRAAVFNQDVQANLFAATFDDGDLVVFDLDTGRPVAVNKEKAYNLVLASSHDGRTLAAVDQLGNLTLFDFRTLQLLYRVKLNTSTLPNGLAFTCDDSRLIEVRDGQCRIWEPPVLRMGNKTHGQHAPPAELKPTTPSEMYRDCEARKTQEVTAITCSHKFPVVFYATGDGSVFGYDISGPNPEKELLFAQRMHSEISSVTTPNSPTSCKGDVGARTPLNRSRKTRPRPRHLEAGSGVFEARETADVITIHSWTDLSSLRVVSISPGLGLSLSGFGPLSHPYYFATYAKRSSQSASTDNETIAILVWDFQDLEVPNPQDVGPRWEIRTSMLPAQVMHLIGVYGTRIVFHTADHWIASFELLPPGASGGAIVAEDSFVRHFFLPSHWIGSMEQEVMRFGLGSEGEIIFDCQGELAVIKRGLELTDDGGAFQPRQLSTKSRAHFGERIPYRPRGISTSSWLRTQGE